MFPMSDSSAQLAVHYHRDLIAEAEAWRHSTGAVARASAHAHHAAAPLRPRPSWLASIATSTGYRASSPDMAVLSRTCQLVAAVGRAFGAALGWFADLPCDSRERLRGKEEELVALGFKWATDLDDDAALAREIEIARQRRWVAGEFAPAGVAEAQPAPSPRATHRHDPISTAGREWDHGIAVPA